MKNNFWVASLAKIVGPSFSGLVEIFVSATHLLIKPILLRFLGGKNTVNK